MTVLAARLRDIADSFDVAVLDQYGVLHDGSEPYGSANDALGFLKKSGKPVVILSNSGKRGAAQQGSHQAIGCEAEPGQSCRNFRRNLLGGL